MEKLNFTVLLASLFWILAFFARIAITRKAGKSAVDEYYWKLVANEYKKQKGLPITLSNKYLMEDDRQAYPPFFGILIGRILNERFANFIMPSIEIVIILILGVVLHFLQTPLSIVFLALGIYVAAPILVIYNTQLTPRLLGDFFLFISLITQFLATQQLEHSIEAIFLWILSSIFISLMIMTHKMTTQLYIFLMPFWALSLSSWNIPLFTAVGFIFFFYLVGWKFGLYQLKAHIDILKFWHKNWRNLGANQFLDSPIYGNPNVSRNQLFHLSGIKGYIKHIKTVISYAPINLLLPIASLISNSWPPLWVIVWIYITYLWSFCTLFVPSLKCLGGGHLYIFNAIVPAAIYISYLPNSNNVTWILVFGFILTLTSILFAWKIISSRKITVNSDFDVFLSYIKNLSKSKIAAFPLQIAEAVAYNTHHSVLWGGHGNGFKPLNGFYPILTEPIEKFFYKYNIEWIIWDSTYWPEGEFTLVKQSIVKESSIKSFGIWRLAKLSNFSPNLEFNHNSYTFY